MAIVLLLIGSGCVSKTPAAPTPTPTAAVTTTAPTVPATVQPTATPGKFAITIKGFAFAPANVTISKGTTVTWTQKDSGITHTVTGSDFDSGKLTQGQTFNYTFNNTGKFNYSCSFHPNMTGNITVT